MRYLSILLLLVLATPLLANQKPKPVFAGGHPYVQYVGRVDLTPGQAPRFWMPGVYAQFDFEGSYCSVVINDEQLYGEKYNYVTLVLDNQAPRRVRLTEKRNLISLGDKLGKGRHRVVVCKSTESNTGYIELEMIHCKNLLPPSVLPERKIEFIGNSITCGTGSDTSGVACGTGQWHDQHNAYLAYGPVTARALNAQWMLSSYSGIGLVRSCCDMKATMPDVYHKMNMAGNDTAAWDFARYTPHVVTIALGQNDGVQDSTLFCSAYVNFIGTVRRHYPQATIVCLTSPMGDAYLTAALKKYLTAVVDEVKRRGDANVHTFFFSRAYTGGCDMHPTIEEHQRIAGELTTFIRKVKGW
ncbi:GDSL-like lipase/acylhydrolase family protein [Breznakibacter xylanolyticus]|uniref:GDSL-like lipase/acylhydrolase family protein n=1 Tax=Breznakibacter xylanolyticus TaxID=990 RepID=A0A2W7N3F1_9BACT|nr:SGNH/GDSL hydrolase family protein [Breznakibacter xylanolyticus]PZX14975.1 GDSL-like lipase/acylhydrolase family protein [Breznakibacter xylanolyticus]